MTGWQTRKVFHSGAWVRPRRGGAKGLRPGWKAVPKFPWTECGREVEGTSLEAQMTCQGGPRTAWRSGRGSGKGVCRSHDESRGWIRAQDHQARCCARPRTHALARGRAPDHGQGHDRESAHEQKRVSDGGEIGHGLDCGSCRADGATKWGRKPLEVQQWWFERAAYVLEMKILPSLALGELMDCRHHQQVSLHVLREQSEQSPRRWEARRAPPL